MPDYVAQSRTITEQQRCFRIVVESPLSGGIRFEFLEERVVVDGANATSELVGGCALNYDPSTVVPVRNPANDALTGNNITLDAVWRQLYSAYRFAADARDAAG